RLSARLHRLDRRRRARVRPHVAHPAVVAAAAGYRVRYRRGGDGHGRQEYRGRDPLGRRRPRAQHRTGRDGRFVCTRPRQRRGRAGCDRLRPGAAFGGARVGSRLHFAAASAGRDPAGLPRHHVGRLRPGAWLRPAARAGEWLRLARTAARAVADPVAGRVDRVGSQRAAVRNGRPRPRRAVASSGPVAQTARQRATAVLAASTQPCRGRWGRGPANRIGDRDSRGHDCLTPAGYPAGLRARGAHHRHRHRKPARSCRMSHDLFADAGATAAGVGPVDGIRVGIGGWTYVPWRKNFYPDGLVQRRELEYASRQLSAIEINGTYYGAQKPETYARWAAETPPDFLFSLKAPRRIMQSRVLAKTGGQIEDFLGGIAALGDRLGPIVWQFDKSTQLERSDFGAFLDLLPDAIDGNPLRHVLDVRVPDFVDSGYLAMARDHGMATVFTDSRDYPSFADVTAGFVYLRLMRSRAEIA